MEKFNTFTISIIAIVSGILIYGLTFTLILNLISIQNTNNSCSDLNKPNEILTK